MHELDFALPRSAFSPREVARPGDIWRAFQEIAVAGSAAAGWPPSRYFAEGTSFIVRAMTVLHHRESAYGEPLVGRTWPSKIRRGMLFRRECRLVDAAGPLASTTQEWVHIDASLMLTQAPRSLLDAFPEEAREPSVELPPVRSSSPIEGPSFELECWHLWMDPLGHVNHPAYVDFCDEALSRWLDAAGLDPVALAPVAESLQFRGGVRARERIRVETRLVGEDSEGAAVFEQRVLGEDGSIRAKATLHRRLAGEDGRRRLLERLATGLYRP